jgi:hypothetical protein
MIWLNKMKKKIKKNKIVLQEILSEGHLA